jgi:sRNA-binding protein
MADDTTAPAIDSPAAPADSAAPREKKKPHGRQRQDRSRANAQAPVAGVNPQRAPHPVLEQLAGLYPVLFGANFLPLKRGIFHDLMAAHPEVFVVDTLKTALALHTRSTRYLIAVADGKKRHDLQGQPVEDMAPEHVYHALQEVFRRRQMRVGDDDLGAKLRRRIVQAFDASGLSRQAYEELVRGKDERANTALDDAMAMVAERKAKDEALLRAFEASGQPMESFADMYGMDPRATAQALERARQPR